MKKLFATAIAAVMALSAASCSDKEKKEQIEVPIYEAAAMTYKTAKSEVSSISQKYIMDGKFSNPYSVPVKFTASGQIKEILVSSNQQVKKGQILCTLFTDDKFNHNLLLPMPCGKVIFLLYCEPFSAKFCFKSCFSALIARFAEQSEHIGLVALYSGLIEWVNSENIS